MTYAGKVVTLQQKKSVTSTWNAAKVLRWTDISPVYIILRSRANITLSMKTLAQSDIHATIFYTIIKSF